MPVVEKSTPKLDGGFDGNLDFAFDDRSWASLAQATN